MILTWAFAVLLIAVAVILIIVQRRIGRQLKSELYQLKKVKKNSIEYEFVLKAMNLSTWHINANTQKIYYDNDYRSKVDNFTPTPGMTIDQLAEIFHPEDRDQVVSALKSLCSGRAEETHLIYRIKVAHSSRFYWEESYATVARRDDEGRPISIVGTSMRIDDRKAMEDALVAARNRAEESDRLKSAFIANMSHEIRTPLNAIIGFTSLLPDITGDQERRQMIELIQENDQKLLSIIDDVMSISKIESGNDQVQFTTFDLKIMLNELASNYAKKAKPGVAMHCTTTSCTITTDQNRLHEILTHMLSNAVKFTQQGSITVGYQHKEDNMIRIFVQDTGIGISTDALPRVFERFFKVNEFVPGAGLGLSTCRTMAYSLGGTVGVESTLGQGSTFWVEIPASATSEPKSEDNTAFASL
jgi:signal transduction histidine kinase